MYTVVEHLPAYDVVWACLILDGKAERVNYMTITADDKTTVEDAIRQLRMRGHHLKHRHGDGRKEHDHHVRFGAQTSMDLLIGGYHMHNYRFPNPDEDYFEED